MTASFPHRSGSHPFRPEMFEQWAPRFPNANSTLTGAVKVMVEAYKDFYATHHRTMGDESITPGARQVKSAKLARAKLIPLVDALDGTMGEAAKVLEHMNAQTRLAYDPADKKYEMVLRHQEIRAHFKSIPQGEKLKLLEAAKRGGDEDTLIALASCQPYLSGLPPQLHDYARDHLIELHAPQEAAVITGIQEQQKLVQQMRDTMLQSVADLVDFKKADEIIAAASADVA
jgi:hypothetical protein